MTAIVIGRRRRKYGVFVFGGGKRQGEGLRKGGKWTAVCWWRAVTPGRGARSAADSAMRASMIWLSWLAISWRTEAPAPTLGVAATASQASPIYLTSPTRFQ